MSSKYRHGGGYKQAALEEGISWNQVTDYSTSINWKATEFYPDHIIYLHQENIDYPDPNYPDLKQLIEEVHEFPDERFLMVHGANEAVSHLFYAFIIQGYNKSKEAVLVGSTYSEYRKYLDLNKFKYTQVENRDFLSKIDNKENKIVIIVNPDTPYGFYRDIENDIEYLLHSGSIVVVDESFIDFTQEKSVFHLTDKYPNLYIIHSLTKFYGSPGARLGLLISSSNLLNDYISPLLPHWTISTYDKWFYKTMIIQYNKIRKETFGWVKEVRDKTEEIIARSKNLISHKGSTTSYVTLEFREGYLKENNIEDFQKFLLKEYKIYVRPTADFFGCTETSFRVGLRLPEENEALYTAIKDIG